MSNPVEFFPIFFCQHFIMSDFSKSFHALCKEIEKCKDDTWKLENELQIKMNNFLSDEGRKTINVDSIDESDVKYLSNTIINKNSNEKLRKCSFLILLRILLETSTDKKCNKIKDCIKKSAPITFTAENASIPIIQTIMKYQNNENAFKRGLDLLQTIYNIKEKEFSPIFPATQSEKIPIHLEYNGGFRKIIIDQGWSATSTRFISLVYATFGVQPQQIKIDPHGNNKLKENQVVTVIIQDNNMINVPKIPVICQKLDEKKIISAATATPISTLIDVINHVFDINTPCRYCLKGNRSIDITQKDVLCSVGYNRGDVIEIIDLFDDSNDNKIMIEFIQLLLHFIDNKQMNETVMSILKRDNVQDAVRSEIKDMKTFLHSILTKSSAEIMFYLNIILKDENWKDEFIRRNGYNRIVDLILKSGKIDDQLEKMLIEILNEEEQTNVQYKLRNILVLLYSLKRFEPARIMLSKAVYENADYFLPEPVVLVKLLESYSSKERQKFMNSIKGLKNETEYFLQVSKSNPSKIFVSMQNDSYIEKLNMLSDAAEAKKLYDEITSNSNLSFKFIESIFNDCKQNITKFASKLVFPMIIKDESFSIGIGIIQKIVKSLGDDMDMNNLLNQFCDFVHDKFSYNQIFYKNGQSDKKHSVLACILEIIEPRFMKSQIFSDACYKDLSNILYEYVNRYMNFDYNAAAILSILLNFPPDMITSINTQLPQAVDDDEEDSVSNSDDDENDDGIENMASELDQAVCLALDTPELIFPFLDKVEQKAKSNPKYLKLYDLNFVMLLLLEKCINEGPQKLKEVVDSAKKHKVDLKILKITNVFENIDDIHSFVEDIDNMPLYGCPLLFFRILLTHKDNNDDEKYIETMHTCLLKMKESKKLFTDMICPCVLRLYESNKLQPIIIPSVPMMDKNVQSKFITDHEVEIVKSIHNVIMFGDRFTVGANISYYPKILKKIWDDTADEEAIRQMMTDIVNKMPNEFSKIKL